MAEVVKYFIGIWFGGEGYALKTRLEGLLRLLHYAERRWDRIVGENPAIAARVKKIAQQMCARKTKPEEAAFFAVHKRAATRVLHLIQEDDDCYAWYGTEAAVAAAARGTIDLRRTPDGLRRGTFKDGRRSTVRVLSDGTILEVRRGDLTGKALYAAEQRGFDSWDEWVAHLEA